MPFSYPCGPSARQRFASQARFRDQDVIIIGDTSCKRAKEKALEAYRKRGFRDLNAGDQRTYVSRKSPFDRILVPLKQKEFRFARQYALISCDPKAHDKQLSDHFLVMTAVKIEEDDDPSEE